MYRPEDLASFALMNFERGLEGLTDEEARFLATKADGSHMNSISFIAGHIAYHWSTVAAYANKTPQPPSVQPYKIGAQPTAPPLADVLELLAQARAESSWVSTANNALLSSSSEEYRALLANLVPVETVGTALMRAIFHTWFHIGEVNAIRQMLGHPEIIFTGPLNGLMEWRSDGE